MRVLTITGIQAEDTGCYNPFMRVLTFTGIQAEDTGCYKEDRGGLKGWQDHFCDNGEEQEKVRNPACLPLASLGILGSASKNQEMF
jgi:hypothetical protein